MKQRLRERLLELVGEVHEDDGVDPEVIRRAASGKRVPERKLLALCRQIERALQLSVPADLGAQIISVSPDADPARLIVLFARDDPEVDAGEVEARLGGLAGPLREAAAQAISRKRVPELVLRLSPAGPTEG